MPVKELDVELTKRGLSKSVAKDNKLLKLGLPTDKLNMWRKMKVSELTQELKARGLKVSGNKDDLLQRLGVPEGYGLTSFEKRMKEHDKKIKEHDKKRKAMVKALGNALGLPTGLQQKKQLSPEDDPNHEQYTIKCCSQARFGEEPSGCITWIAASWNVGGARTVATFPACPMLHRLKNIRMTIVLVMMK